jgi:Outer membrane protein beta-barrel domain
MTKQLIVVPIAATLALIVGAPSAAAQWAVRPFVGAALQSDHGFIDLEQSAGATKLLAGIAVEWRPRSVGVEVEFGVAPGFLSGSGNLIRSSRLTTLMANLIWQLPRPAAPARLRGYLAGGAGIMRVGFEDALDAFTSTSSLWAGNVGGGVSVRLLRQLDLNADARFFKSQFGDPDPGAFGEPFVEFVRVTVSAVLRFTAPPP